MSYKVLARKWRPDHFDEVVGQEHVARTLINSIEQDRVAHSYLFCGARGVGKTSTARILAKAMNCEEGPTAKPCYNCPSCEEISNGQSVDVFEIDGASNRGINEIRELREGVRYAPSRDEYKIYIIDEVHMLTTEAFNALLKTLEEPPPHAIFIFATTEPQKIPVTILSRCQRFDFKRISQRDIVSHLEELCEHEGLEAEKAALQIIARQANGGMRDALSLLDQIISFSGDQITEREIAEILGVANRKHLFELSEAVLARSAEKALLVLDEVNRYGYDLQQFASELVNHFRDLMVTAVVEEPEKVIQLTENELEAARAQTRGLSSELLHRYFSVMVDGAQEMSRSEYPKLIFEMTLVRLSELEPMEKLDLLVDRLELLEGTLEDDADGDIDWPQHGGRGSGTPNAQPTQEAASTTDVTSSQMESTSTESGDDNAPTFETPQGVEMKSTGTDASAEAAASPELDPADPEPDPGRAESETGVETSESEQQSGKPEARTDESVRAANDDDDESEDDTDGDDSAPTRSGPTRPPIDAYESGSAQSTTGQPSPSNDSSSGDNADAPENSAAGDAASEVTPRIPQPLSPSEISDVEIPDVDELDGAVERWRATVEYLRHRAAPVAATCEHGHLHEFSDGEVRLQFTDEFIGFAQEETRRNLLEEAVLQLFGQDWSVLIERRDEDDPIKYKSLAQERREDIERRRKNLEQKMRHHSVVESAREIFDAGQPRVSVTLYDE